MVSCLKMRQSLIAQKIGKKETHGPERKNRPWVATFELKGGESSREKRPAAGLGW